jgi:hypothetical protein
MDKSPAKQNGQIRILIERLKRPFREFQVEWGYLMSLREVQVFWVILNLAFIHGLFYVFMVPPWQHYDEPNHFEYVWLTANLDHQTLDEFSYDQELARQVFISMLENDFYKDQQNKPSYPTDDQAVPIPGLRQLTEPPLFYSLAAIPLRIFPYTTVEQQLFAARIISLIFFMITIIASWGAIWEITQEGNPLRWMVPLSLALLPGFVDVMTAVNSDTAAVAIFSLFFWGSMRLMKRGFNLLDAIWVLITAITTYFTKNTAMYAIIFLPIAMIFSIFKYRFRKYLWMMIGVMALFAFLISFDWGDAASWYRCTAQKLPTRTDQTHILGDYAFRLESAAEITPGWMHTLFQPIQIEKGKTLSNQTVTFGGWIWASEPVQIESPIISTPCSQASVPIELTQTPTFFAFQTTLPEDSWRTWLILARRLPADRNIEIYYDGLVFAQGNYPIESSPVFNSTLGAYGKWGDKPFQNLLRNPSAEVSGPQIRSFIDDLGTKVLPDRTRMSLILTSVLDLKTSGYLYRISIDRLFKTFWATFGWGHIHLIWDWYYWILGVFSIMGFLGLLIWLFHRPIPIPWDLVFYIALIVLLVWGATTLRGAIYLGVSKLYIPVARHAYPIIIPTLLALCVGWVKWFDLLRSNSQNTKNLFLQRLIYYIPYILFFVFFLVLDILSIISIIGYYTS